MRELDELISEIVGDCYDEEECMTAFCTVLGDEIQMPFEVAFLLAHDRFVAGMSDLVDMPSSRIDPSVGS